MFSNNQFSLNFDQTLEYHDFKISCEIASGNEDSHT